MKILVIANDTQTVIWFRQDMIKGFLKKGYSVTIIAPDKVHKAEIENMGARLIEISYNRTGTNIISDMHLYNKYYLIIKKEKPDKIFAYNLKPILYGILAAKKAKIDECYAMIPGAGYVFSGYSMKSKFIKCLIKQIYKKALKNTCCVFFQNVDDKNQFCKERIVEEKKAVVVNGSGINLEQFRYCDMPETISFLFGARLLKSKGIIEFCKVAEELKKKYPNIQFNVVGGVDKNPTCIDTKLLKYYEDNKIINYYGKVSNMIDYFRENAVLVLPSYHREGVPHVVLEAMAVGRIIITTDEIGCRETVKDGINGFKVEAKNVEMLSEKMEELIKNYEKYKIMGYESRKYAEEKFDVKKVNDIIYTNMGV